MNAVYAEIGRIVGMVLFFVAFLLVAVRLGKRRAEDSPATQSAPPELPTPEASGIVEARSKPAGRLGRHQEIQERLATRRCANCEAEAIYPMPDVVSVGSVLDTLIRWLGGTPPERFLIVMAPNEVHALCRWHRDARRGKLERALVELATDEIASREQRRLRLFEAVRYGVDEEVTAEMRAILRAKVPNGVTVTTAVVPANGAPTNGASLPARA